MLTLSALAPADVTTNGADDAKQPFESTTVTTKRSASDATNVDAALVSSPPASRQLYANGAVPPTTSALSVNVAPALRGARALQTRLAATRDATRTRRVAKTATRWRP